MRNGGGEGGGARRNAKWIWQPLTSGQGVERKKFGLDGNVRTYRMGAHTRAHTHAHTHS